jgi:hypothetical protein
MNNSELNPLGGVSLSPEFNSHEKWLAISSVLTIVESDTSQDIAFSVAGGPYTIQPHDSLNVAFAIAGGYSLDELRTTIQNSREAYGLIPTSVEQKENEVPLEFSLSQNYPNPFNPTTKIKFTIATTPISSSLQKGRTKEGFVTLRVYDILGREIKTLINKPMQPGEYEIEFDASDLSSGVYFYRLSAGSFVKTKKMILLR